jgi:rubrerythrin
VTRRIAAPEDLLAGLGEPLDPARYDWAEAAMPLTTDELFQLTYAAQVEWGTEGYFASLNISKDPVVKEFLETWLAQEIVHGDLLSRVLAAQGVSIEATHRSRRQRFITARGRAVNKVARRVVGDDFFAVHMSWGAVNELTTLRFYGVMRSRTTNPTLQAVLRDVMAQEALHYNFYRAMAIRRLDGNRRAQRMVRWVLQHLWSPVGVGLHTRSDADEMVRGLVGDRRDVVAQIDGPINRMPGLDGLDLTRRTVDRALAA